MRIEIPVALEILVPLDVPVEAPETDASAGDVVDVAIADLTEEQQQAVSQAVSESELHAAVIDNLLAALHAVRFRHPEQHFSARIYPFCGLTDEGGEPVRTEV